MLEVQNLSAGYDKTWILQDINLCVESQKFTVFLGPNGCGKSTLFKAIGRLLKETQGKILLQGQNIQEIPSKQVAQKMALLPQHPIAPDGVTALMLVRYGRSPYQGLLGSLTLQDHEKVEEAMRQAGVLELQNKFLKDLSGGQRQRVWLAMILAQDADLVLLDEPTNHLDVHYQYDVLERLKQMQSQGKTIAMVMHDLNQAARYADFIYLLQKGKIYQQGSPEQVLTEETVRHVFRLENQIIKNPVSNTPLCIPITATSA